MLKTPIVFIVFNRPEPTRKVLQCIRQAKPKELLVISDGPRSNVQGDLERVDEVREIIRLGVDWPCKVKRNYSPNNLGCRKRVASGLNWVFEQVPEAIILEDDCVPHPDFFTFCESMLSLYRGDEDVMHINGTSFLSGLYKPLRSHCFTRYAWPWGWATWRRAWKLYDYEMRAWEDSLNELPSTFSSRKEWTFWKSTWEEAKKDWPQTDSWAFPWMFTCRLNNRVSIMPKENLIQNVGFNADATHTTAEATFLSRETYTIRITHERLRKHINPLRDNAFFRHYTNSCSLRHHLRGIASVIAYKSLFSHSLKSI